MGAGELALPFAACCRPRDGTALHLGNSTTTQVQIHGFILVQPNIYPIYELLDG